MAGQPNLSKDLLVHLIKQLGMDRYLKNFEKIGFFHQDLNFLTIYDLQHDLNISQEDSAILMEAFFNTQSKPGSLCLNIINKQRIIRKNLKNTKFTIGSHKSCDIHLENFNFSHVSCSWSRPEVFCEIQFDNVRNFYYVTSTGNQQVFIKLPEIVQLRDGMEILMGMNEFKVIKITKDLCGSPLFCHLLKDENESIVVGKNGITFGKGTGLNVGLDECAQKIHAAIDADFILQSYGPVYELIKRGDAYPFYIGSCLIIEDFQICFEE